MVAPGFAFAHAQPRRRCAAYPGSGWPNRLRSGTRTNDPVTLVVALGRHGPASAHATAMAQLAKVVGNYVARAALDEAARPADVLAVLGGATAAAAPLPVPPATPT